ncbi:MAG: Nif3-like dinuclear metal center hexameric protein [Bacilli bacterium]|nr:Nif3-like dinuclear metal center hexameric protein [Bacilli bacterium]
MKSSTLLYHLRRLYPKRVAFPGDFIGLQTGKIKKEIHHICVCLDFDDDVWNVIKNKQVDLILTHHPLIYGKRKEVLAYDEVKRKLVKTIDHLHIPVYSMHTNFDCAHGGMNDQLAQVLGLKNVKPLKNEPMARGGVLPHPMEVHAFARYVKKQLHLPSVYLINRGAKQIKKVALCGGAGSGIFKFAREEGYDIFLSGDAPHHIRHDINCCRYNYLEIMHEVEQIFVPTLTCVLKELNPSLKVTPVAQKYPEFI